jgi:predicted GIY-YIG superfamily endonuclease
MAIAREKQIKGWSRSKKLALMNQENPKWNDPTEDWYSPPDGPAPTIPS